MRQAALMRTIRGGSYAFDFTMYIRHRLSAIYGLSCLAKSLLREPRNPLASLRRLLRLRRDASPLVALGMIVLLLN